MQPMDIVIERYRDDTKRTDKWKLRVPRAYITHIFSKTVPEDTNSYYLDLVIGSEVPATIQAERLKERRIHESTEMWRKLNADFTHSLLRIKLGGASFVSAAERSRRQYGELTSKCERATSTYFGMIQYKKISTTHKSDRDRPSCLDNLLNKNIYAAGRRDGAYEVVIACINYRYTLGTCIVMPFIVSGWRVEISFHGSHLAQWRDVIKQAEAFLRQKTVEDTSGLASTDLTWL
jgi:hypothetical protein